MAQEEACEGDQHGWGEVLDKIVDGGGHCGVQFRQKGKGKAWDLVNGHKEVLWKQTEPCVALLQITSEMTATTQGRGNRGRLGRKKKKNNTW
jgi:hypothetical protein